MSSDNNDAPKLLQVRNLETTFSTDTGQVKAVAGISFDLREGEALGIVGESGSGKSVTALSIMGLIPSPPGRITGGEILYRTREGTEINLVGLSERAYRHFRGNEMAMIFQEPMTSLNPVFTCGNQVAEAIMLHQRVNKKEALERTVELFREVQLDRPEQMVNAYPHQLSGGQKQRVMIAMAISCRPKLLIADEPTTALDVTVQAAILDLMRSLQERYGMAIIFITHDLGVIAEIASRIIVMYQGEIVEQGPIEQIFLKPGHPYTKGLLACRPPLKRHLRRLPTIQDFFQWQAREQSGEGPDVAAIMQELEVKPHEVAERLERLQTQPPLLKVEGLKTWFPIRKGVFGRVRGYVKAVDDVSFEVYPGETLGLVGESGSGKTTIGRSIIRLVEATDGRITYKGRNLLELNRRELQTVRREIQIIFQDPYSSLNPRITIGSAIMEPMRVHGLYENDQRRREKVMELLEQVHLSADFFNRYPHEFSGGQRQRICIARALAVQPRLLICDESVSALDVSIQAQVLNLLNELRDAFGLTYIFISHDLSVVKFMADRIVVLNRGRIEEIGPADEVYFNPQRPYTKKLIAAIPTGEIKRQGAGLYP